MLKFWSLSLISLDIFRFWVCEIIQFLWPFIDFTLFSWRYYVLLSLFFDRFYKSMLYLRRDILFDVWVDRLSIRFSFFMIIFIVLLLLILILLNLVNSLTLVWLCLRFLSIFYRLFIDNCMVLSMYLVILMIYLPLIMVIIYLFLIKLRLLLVIIT